jgi:hypothetical protein
MSVRGLDHNLDIIEKLLDMERPCVSKTMHNGPHCRNSHRECGRKLENH